MSLFNLSNHFDELTDNIKNYIESSADYYKLDAFKKLMNGVVSLVNLLVIGSIFLVFLLFISVAVAILIGNHLENISYGYFIVGGFFFLVFLFMITVGRKIIGRVIVKKSSKLFFDESRGGDVLEDEFKHLKD